MSVQQIGRRNSEVPACSRMRSLSDPLTGLRARLRRRVAGRMGGCVAVGAMLDGWPHEAGCPAVVMSTKARSCARMPLLRISDLRVGRCISKCSVEGCVKVGKLKTYPRLSIKDTDLK